MFLSQVALSVAESGFSHRLRTPDSYFQQYPKYLDADLGRSAKKTKGIWGIFCRIIRKNIVHGVVLISHFFHKKLSFSYILKKYLFGFGIWVLAIKNLGSSHHASVVRGFTRMGNRHQGTLVEIAFLESVSCDKLRVNGRTQDRPTLQFSSHSTENHT